MRVLLDTQIFLWYFLEPKRILPEVKEFLENSFENECYLSHVSSWEIAIKYGTKKLEIPDIPERYVKSRVAEAGFHHLAITLDHVTQVHSLAPIHRDPFDRLLVSQARVEKLALLTADPHFAKYPVDVLNALDLRV